ncbi:MAG: hypothetical protein JOZ36_14800 [Acidobacteria bacterium]|nr:hypothetical protein [Acidobacteriota bacterium]
MQLMLLHDKPQYQGDGSGHEEIQEETPPGSNALGANKYLPCSILGGDSLGGFAFPQDVRGRRKVGIAHVPSLSISIAESRLSANRGATWYNLFFRMRAFLKQQRFGQPQFLAALLLLIFVGQCAWLIRSDLHSGRLSREEQFILRRGLEQWRGNKSGASVPGQFSFDGEAAWTDWFTDSIGQQVLERNHSRLYYLVSSAPLLLWPAQFENRWFVLWGWLARAAGLFFGLCLAASLWYVARRLYGNAGGYIALLLFCFSPGLIRTSAGWFTESETAAAWGAFGAIFTAVAVAHTLYAPREVVLWNWRRIVLLGVALALAIGSQFLLIVLVALVPALLFYLAPNRIKAGLAIWVAASSIALLVLLASYFFSLSRFWSDIHNRLSWTIAETSFCMPGAYRRLLTELIDSCPVLLLAMPAALLVFFLWRRTRYFGNGAPLLVGVALLTLALLLPHGPGVAFPLIALPFLFLFVAGMCADVLETRYRRLVLPALAGVLAAYALRTLLEVARVRI